MAGEQHSEWFQEINAEHTVPAMTHGDVTLCQSSDIARYLVTTFAKGHKLYPDHEETRCKIDEFLEYCQTDLLPHVKEIVVRTSYYKPYSRYSIDNQQNYVSAYSCSHPVNISTNQAAPFNGNVSGFR